MKSELSATASPQSKNYVSPILRRVFSKSNFIIQNRPPLILMVQPPPNESIRSESRLSTEQSSIGSGSPGTKSPADVGRGEDLVIDVTTEENVQFMDQPLRGKIELNGLPAPIEGVSIALRGVVKTCVASNTAWTSGFGGDSNVMARFTEKEVSTPNSRNAKLTC